MSLQMILIEHSQSMFILSQQVNKLISQSQNQIESHNMQINTLLVLQAVNIFIALIFLGLFLYQLNYLRHFSQTDTYLNYYPKIRILFALTYVFLSLSLLIYNIITKQYSKYSQDYLFEGGGGQSINSLVLVLQLVVLRQQLKKQRPYTRKHMIYFAYLTVISVVRFGLTIASLVQNNKEQIVGLILSTCIMLDSVIQLGYWIAKKQTLPQFQSNDYFSFDQFRNHTVRQLTNPTHIFSRIQQKSCQDDFPYIKSTVQIQNSKFRIILEIFVTNKILPQNFDETDIEKLYQGPSQIKDKNVSKIVRQSVSFRISEKRENKYNSKGNHNKSSLHLQIISQHVYNLQQIKQLYMMCGRFPVKKQVKFSGQPLRVVAQHLQQFLDQLFEQKRNYQQFLLRYFQVDKEFIETYSEKLSDQKQIIVSDYHEDPLKIKQKSYFDKNSSYLSVQIYRQLWIQDHYEFYMKICIRETNEIAYPMRRYSEFQDFDNKLRDILLDKAKLSGPVYQLPQLPKKHLFYWDHSKIKERRVQLELYLRKLCNDPTLMQLPQIREVILRFLNFYTKVLSIHPVFQPQFFTNIRIIKGNISKALIANDYVTFYEFKLFRQGIQIRAITKRFNQFVTLDQDLHRWMHNISVHYKAINLPQKHLYKSEVHRHQKLRNYLQSIIQIKESYTIYPLNVFFNVSGNEQISDDTFYSAISFVRSKNKQGQEEQKYSNSNEENGHLSREGDYEMERNPRFSFSTDGKRMSALIDELGE